LQRPARGGWRASDLIYILAAGLVLFLAAHGLLRKVTWYLAIDQYGYLTFAGDLAQGKVFHSWPPIDALTHAIRFPSVDVRAQTYVFDGARMFCRYTPGFPILLAAWMRLFGPSAGHYINPIFFLLLLGVHLQLTRRIFAGVAGARWLALTGILLLLMLPSYLHLWAITILRDIPAQVFAMTAILLSLPSAHPMHRARAAAIGFLFGYLIAIRIDAALFGLPVGILFLSQPRERGALPVAACLFAVGISPLLAYNYAATGNPLRPTQAMEVEQFLESRRPPPPRAHRRLAGASRIVLPPRPAASTAVTGITGIIRAGFPGRLERSDVAAPSPAPARLAARGVRAPRAAQPPVHGGGFKLRHLTTTFPGNLRYLRNAFGNVILGLAIVGAVAAWFTNRLLLTVTVPYCLAALVFYSCWVRPDPRYLAGIFVLTPILALGGLVGLDRLGTALRRHRLPGVPTGRTIGIACAAALAVAWRHEFEAVVPVLQSAWEAGAWRGGSPLPVVSAIVGLVAIAALLRSALRNGEAPANGRLAVILAALLLVTAVLRSVPGWHRRASFQATQVDTARRTIESLIEPGAVVITTTEVGRPAENIDHYTHAHALYLQDLERWRLPVWQAAGKLLGRSHGVYLLMPTSSPRGRNALRELGHLEVTRVAHVEAADAPGYFVASRFGTYPLDIYRVALPAALRNAIDRTR
jgi:hypothetical protein